MPEQVVDVSDNISVRLLICEFEKFVWLNF